MKATKKELSDIYKLAHKYNFDEGDCYKRAIKSLVCIGTGCGCFESNNQER